MKTSEKITSVMTALLKFQGQVNRIQKDAKNPHFKSSYASLSKILEETNPVLTECGLVLTQHFDVDVLTTMLCHAESGEYMQSDYPINVKDASNPQQFGSALSYARRYGVQSILNLNASDDDGHAAAVGHAPSSTAPLETVTLKSTKWKKGGESYVIKEIEAGKSPAEIITSLSKRYVLASDVLQFIEDNARPTE
jgi:hypothetical protein